MKVGIGVRELSNQYSHTNMFHNYLSRIPFLSLSSRIEWVEIIEPRSREKMFVNLVSGECGWDEPIGVKIKRIHEQEGHQWWELYDVKTSRFYYYNATTQQTCWQKPKNNSAIIIPLAKLQLLKQNNLSGNGSSSAGSSNNQKVKETRDVSVQTKNSCLVLVNNSTQTTPPPSLRRGMCYGLSSSGASGGDGNDTWSTKRSLRSYLINEARFARGLTSLNHEDLAMSDYDEEFWESDDGDDDESTTSDQWDADDEIDHDDEGDDEEEEGDEDEDENEDVAAQVEILRKKKEKLEREVRSKVINNERSIMSQKEKVGVEVEKNHHEKPLQDEDEEEDDDEEVEEEPSMETRDESRKSSVDSNSYNNSTSNQSRSLVESNSSFVYIKPKSPPKTVVESFTPNAPKSASFTSGSSLIQRSQSIREHKRPSFDATNLPREFKSLSMAGGPDADLSDESIEHKPRPPPHKAPLRTPVPPQRGLSLGGYDTSYLPSPPKIGPFASPPSMKVSPSLSSHSHSSPAQGTPDSDGHRRFKESTPAQHSHHQQVHHRNIFKDPSKETLSSLDSSLSRIKSVGSKLSSSKKNHNNNLSNGSSSNKTSQEMEKFARENVARHIKSGVGNQLLKRKTSLKAMLSWSKKCIKSPMIATLMSNGSNSNATTRADIKSEAIHCFKLIQLFMGDRVPSERKDTIIRREEIAFELISTACSRHELRDEIFVQLCRQTTDNPRKSSVVLGLHLMACCLTYFHPSVKFSPYLASYLSNTPLKELPALAEKEDIEAISLVDHCYHLLIKVRGALLGSGSGGSGSMTIYCRKPVTAKELEMVSEAVDRRFPGIFGESLPGLMQLQGRRWSNKKLPWILTTLCEAVLKMGGASTEGIFRIAADADELSFIKLVIDCINFDLLEDEGDILDLLNQDSDEPVDVHVFACLLKQWFRSLMEPLIPFNLYEVCLEYSSSPADATSIVVNQLPTLNRLVLGYLIRFLQVFAAPENVNFTKMDDSNLSMVWAPNILRSPQSNNLTIHPSIIFENTRKEMTFIRTLIQSLDTSFMQGVY